MKQKTEGEQATTHVREVVWDDAKTWSPAAPSKTGASNFRCIKIKEKKKKQTISLVV